MRLPEKLEIGPFSSDSVSNFKDLHPQNQRELRKVLLRVPPNRDAVVICH